MPTPETLLDNHLGRLAVWSAIWLGMSLVFLVGKPKGVRHGFAALSAGWCLVNLIIVGASKLFGGPTPLPQLREFLAFNVGLGFAYVGVGITMVALSQNRPFARGAGMAVTLQGAVLLVLDAWLLFQLPSVAGNSSG